VNHGCHPNCQTVNTGRRIFIEALRTIQPGEELAYDYQIQRDHDDPADVDVIFACHCGAPGCRGSMLEAPKKKRRPRRASPKRKVARKVVRKVVRKVARQGGRQGVRKRPR
jgi:hypothetical protein